MAKGKTAFHGNPASAVEFFTRSDINFILG